MEWFLLHSIANSVNGNVPFVESKTVERPAFDLPRVAAFIIGLSKHSQGKLFEPSFK